MSRKGLTPSDGNRVQKGLQADPNMGMRAPKEALNAMRCYSTFYFLWRRDGEVPGRRKCPAACGHRDDAHAHAPAPGTRSRAFARRDDMAYGTAHGTAYGTAMNGEAGLALAGLASRSDAARLGSVTVRSSRTSLSVYSPC
jgi:hypothetical protein